jgi:hypothetical protein
LGKQMSADELWKRALDHAGVQAEHVRRIELPGLSSTRIAQHVPPNTTASNPGPFAYSNEELAIVNRDADVHRVVHTGGIEEPALIGLLRSQLEHVRQFDSQFESYFLTNIINASIHEEYKHGRGGAVVYLALPMMRDAQAAGAELIRASFGPQFGKFGDPYFGLLYRTDREPGSLNSLPQRTVVFAAIHADAFEQLLGGDESARQHLHRVDPAAPNWWTRLKADDLFGHLSKSAPAFKPTAEEIEQFGENASAGAWRPLEALLDRALEHGLFILNQED